MVRGLKSGLCGQLVLIAGENDGLGEVRRTYKIILAGVKLVALGEITK